MFEFRSECSEGIRKEVDLLNKVQRFNVKLKDGYQKKKKPHKKTNNNKKQKPLQTPWWSQMHTIRNYMDRKGDS